MAAATGALRDDAVWVDDVPQANRLHSKGGTGTPQPGNALRLSRVEAAYAVAKGWLQIPEVPSWQRLLAEGQEEQAAYLVYRDLRERGLSVRDDGHALAVWQRGQPVRGEPWFHAVPMSEHSDPTAGGLVAIAAAEQAVGIADDDGSVTHYQTRLVTPAGGAPEPAPYDGEGTVMTDRVLVADGRAVAALRQADIGTEHGDEQILSLVEAAAEQAAGRLHLDHSVDPPGAPATVHADLRMRGVLARSGLRFGTHFRAYEGPVAAGHATWLVQCTGPDDPQPWTHLSRAIRLAHGVRKRFLLAVTGEPVQYVELEWFRP